MWKLVTRPRGRLARLHGVRGCYLPVVYLRSYGLQIAKIRWDSSYAMRKDLEGIMKNLQWVALIIKTKKPRLPSFPISFL